MMYYSPESEADSTEEKKGNSDSEDEVLIYPYPDEHCSRTFPVPDSFRLRVRKRKSSGKQNLMSGCSSSQNAMSTSLSSPISILASSPSGGSTNGSGGYIHSSGPLSAPATFSWGAHSPIPPRCSPIVVVPTPTSPYLLSPGRDHYSSPPHTTTVSTMGVGFSGSAVLTSSPLMPSPSPLDVGRGCSPLLAQPRPSSSLSMSSPLIGGSGPGPGPAVTSCSFLPGGPMYTGSEGSGGVMSVASSLQSATTSDPHLAKPGIPVGIAVARQRHKDTTSSLGSSSVTGLQTKDDPAPQAPLAAWPFHLLPPTHHALPPTHHALPPTHHALPPTHHALPPTHHALPPTHLQHHPSGGGAPLPPSLLHPGASLPQSHPSMPLQDYGRYLTAAAAGSNNSSSSSNPAAPSPGSRPSAFSPTSTYQQQQAQAVAGTSAQAAPAGGLQAVTAGGLQAVAAASAPGAGTNPFWSPFSSYYPFLLHSAAAYHHQAAASMPTALQHYHHQLLMLHAQQSLYSGDKGILDPYSALHHLQRQSTALAVPGSSTPVPGGSSTPVPGSSSTGVHLSVPGTSKEEGKPAIIPQDDSGLGLDSSRLDHSSSSRGRHDSASSSRGRHMSATLRPPSYLSSTPNTTLEGSSSNLLRPSIPLLPLDFTTGRGSISGLRGDSPSSESSVVMKSPKVDRSSRSSTPLNRSTTPLNRSTTPLNRSTTPLNRSTTPQLTNRARTPLDVQNMTTGLTSTPTSTINLSDTSASLTCTHVGGGSQAKEEKSVDRSSEEDNISVGTESIEASNTTPNNTSPTQQSIEELLPVTGGPNTTSQKLSSSPVEVLTKKMWQCKQDLQNNSDKSVIGKPSKIRCVDQKFLSGERLPEKPTNHNLKESIAAEPSNLELVHENSSLKDTASHITAVCHSQVKSEQGIVETQAERDENGLHLLYEGIQKQLSRTPSADDRYSEQTPLVDVLGTNKPRDNGHRLHQPLDERTGEFILKDDKENDLKRDMYLANQLIDFATENLQQKPAKIIVRHASVDSPLSRHQHIDDVTEEGGDVRRVDLLKTPSKVRLGLLCDVATERMAEEEGLTGTAQLRIARSRSDDPERHNIRRTSPASKQNIREFIERRSSRSSEGHSPARLNSGSPFKAGSSPYRAASSPYRLGASPVKGGTSTSTSTSTIMVDIDDMDAWEISMRLDMAHIQKKYREKYRELYMLESRKERSRKTSGRQAQPPTTYKRSSSDHKNSNNRVSASHITTPVKSPKNSIETAKPTVTHKDPSDSEEIKVKHIDNTTALTVENNNSPLSSPCKSSPLPEESPTTSPPVVSSFHETFAKFKKSYHNNRGGVNNRYNGNNNPNNVANGDSRSLANTPVTGSSMLKVKIDRPTPFANWLRLSSTGSNGTSSPLSPSIIKPEPKVYQQPPLSPNATANNGVKSECMDDDGEELLNDGHQHKPEVAKVFKRKMSHRTSEDGDVTDESYVDGSRSPKKKAKYDKYVVDCKSYDTKSKYDEDLSSDERRKAKRREHKRHKDKSHHHHHRRSHNHYHQTHLDHNNHHDLNTQISHEDARPTTDDTDFTKMMVGKKKWMRMHNHEPEELDKISKYNTAPSNGDDMNDNDDVVKVKREYSDGYEDGYDAKSYKEHKKDKKRDKEKKKKRSKDKKRQKVHVRDENDYICEIMDRTPTPSSGGRVNIKQEAAAVKMEAIDDEQNEVKEEPVEYDWADIQAMMKASELTEPKLRDGQRILTRIGGHFYPGRITEISPPDIYGILVDRERGNKPHICSREEVLTKAILEVSPGRIEALQPGARVCAYWSSKYHYLHPGTVVENTQGLNLPRGYVVIELDDGDSRDFHVDSIRFLPPSYPLVVGESDPFMGLGQVRRRRTSSIEASPIKKTGAFPSKKSVEKKSEKSGKRWKSEITPNNLKIRIRSPEADTPPPGPAPGEWGCTVKLEEREPPVLTPQDDIRHPGLNSTSTDNLNLCPKLEPGLNHDRDSHFQLPPTSIAGGGQHGDPGAGLMIRDDDQDSAFESVGRGEEEDDLDDLDSADLQVNYERKRMPSADKSKIRAFLPPSHLLWAWKDKGVKPKNKTRKIFHTSIFRDDEVLKVGDSAVFLSTSRPDRPYIGKLEDMWESWSGNMKVRVRWFYHSEEAEGTGEGGRRAVDLRLPGALFESSHFDENDIQTISHKCDVVPVDEFASRLACTPGLREAIYENNELYYTAGTYDPVVGTLSFQPNVFNI